MTEMIITMFMLFFMCVAFVVIMRDIQIKKSTTVRVVESVSELNGTYYTVEVKTQWFGWQQPAITYSEDGVFYSKREALKWHKYIANGRKDKSKIIKNGIY